jgi:hypothetical protein
VEASDPTLTFTQNDKSTPPKVIVDNSGPDGTFFSS